MRQTRALASRDDEHGSRYLWAEIRGDGSLVVAGQDLSSPGSNGFLVAMFGEGTTEYEYATAVAPAEIPAALEHLGLDAEGDPLDELGSLPDEELFTLTGRLRRSGLTSSSFNRAG